MTSKILQIKGPVHQDTDIIGQQYHTYTPYTTSFDNNDEIRIVIQSQDLYVLPSESYLYIELSAAKADGTAFGINEATFSFHPVTHLFSEMRYELNGFEIDRCKTPGITSLLKSMIACRPENESALALMAAFSTSAITASSYQMLLPLRFVFGFCDDFKKIVMNSKHELILVRSRTNNTFYEAATDILQLTVNKIQWKVPHVSLSDGAKLSLLKTVSRNESLFLPFRSWDLYELPGVPDTTRHTWSVKTTSQVNKPRYVVVVFQTNRNNVVSSNSTMFDHCNISSMKLYLNNERFPYDDMRVHLGQNYFFELYHMFQAIQQTYYNETSVRNPLGVSLTDFQQRPIFAFDCSRTDESVKKGMVDVRIEMDASANIPRNTTAYCLIIHDNLVEYSPFTSMVSRVM